MRVLAKFLSGCSAIALTLSATPAVADDMLTMLTLDGQLLPLAEVPQPILRRIARAEGGFNVVVDDYAVLRHGGQGAQLSFTTEAFRINRIQLAAATGRLDEVSSGLAPGRSLAASRSQGAGKSALTRFALIVRHRYAHPVGHNFTPTPQAEFLPTVVDVEFEGQRGFAVVSIGETGRVRQVKLLAETGPMRAPQLQAAIESGITTLFQDERRHDHTVYMAYEVQGQVVRQVGQAFVTLPMCCGGCRGICP